MGYDWYEHADRALATLNELFLKMMVSTNPLLRAYSPHIRRWIYETRDKRIRILVFRVESVWKDIYVAAYATTDHTRPLTWKRIEPKIRRVARMLNREVGPHRDGFIFILPAHPRVRTTLDARRHLAANRIMVLDPGTAYRIFKEYLKRRLLKWVEKAGGRRNYYYGPVADAIWIFYALVDVLEDEDKGYLYRLCSTMETVINRNKVSYPCRHLI